MVPADLDFCDLRVPEVREAQGGMAREYGVSGFCYHDHGFNDKRLLDGPFDEVSQPGAPAEGSHLEPNLRWVVQSGSDAARSDERRAMWSPPITSRNGSEV